MIEKGRNFTEIFRNSVHFFFFSKRRQKKKRSTKEEIVKKKKWINSLSFVEEICEKDLFKVED